VDEELERVKNRGWRRDAAIDAAHAAGEIDDAAWHRAMAAEIVPAYLAAEDERGGSGHSGTAEDWEWSRGVVAEAIDRPGAFLDIGCANGLLMESVARWGAATGLPIEPYGLDISPELAAVARQRLPAWSERIFVANALGWRPPRRFDFVRTGLEYVPASRRRELVAWLLDEVVEPGGRVVIGKYNEELDDRRTEADVRAWGFAIAGRHERAHRSHPRIAYRVVCIDAPKPPDDLRFRALRRDDLPLLQHWLARPHVEAWWHDTLDEDAMRAKYLPRIDGTDPTHVHILEHAGTPIGWLQWYRWRDYAEHATRIGADPTTAGIDLALGDASLLGRGLGTRALKAFVDTLVFAHADITACTTDPETANIASLRMFAKAGFHETGTAGARTIVTLKRAASAPVEAR
jgi:RimJ/RimL family protein N-acetyltransferase/2-polyprenyl-3-methyl-5-hydroxy-6-metoxy-1,4-benzoquinol methylase